MTALRVRHVTAYAYEGRVELATHLLHLRPRELPWQHVPDFTLEANPASNLLRWSTDHFGNAVACMFLDHAHSALEIVTEALVLVEPRTSPHAETTPAWEHIAAMARKPQAASTVAEFTFASPMAPPDAETGAYAAKSFNRNRPILAGLLDLMERIHHDFRFDPEVTTVSTPVRRVFQLRAGVCQDFAHLMIAGLRALGLPARYVSGYVRTIPPPGQARRIGADHSHAWVGCWLGPEHGWIDLDPTNNLIVGDEHVWLGWGRDYACVSPIRGMLLGGGKHTLQVSVDIAPEHEKEPLEALRRAG